MPNTSVRDTATRADWFVLSLLGLSLGLNVLLGLVVVRLLSTSPATSQAGTAPQGPKVGQVLPPFEAERLGGQRERIEFSSTTRPTLVYVFKTDCIWCERNQENVEQLLSSVSRTHNVLLLSLGSDVNESRKVFPADLPIYVRPAASLFKPYGLGPTPLTVVVSPQGTVVRSWVGAYVGETKKAVETHFGIALPGAANRSN